MSIEDDIAAIRQQPANNIEADVAAIRQPPVVEQPSFLKKVDMIASGVDRGVKNFTLALMSKLPLGNSYQNAIKAADARSTAEQEGNIQKYGALYPKIGEVSGEILATLPAGGVFGKVGQAAMKAGEIMPTGLKTLFKYGTAAAGTTEAAALLESQRYDPSNPGQMFNKEAAMDIINNPAGAALAGTAGTKLATWGQAAKKLGEARSVLPSATAENIKPDSASKTLSQEFFGITPALLGVGYRANQLKNTGPLVSEFIMKQAGSKEALTADKLTEYSANIFQSTLQKMKKAEDEIWDKGFKTVSVKNAQEVKDDVVSAIDLLVTNKTPGYEASVNSLKNGLRKSTLTVEDVKKLQGSISSAAISARGLEGGVGNELAGQLKVVKDNLLSHIQNSLSPEQMKDFSAARAFSANKFELFDNAPMLQKAIEDTTNAHKLVGTLISEGGVLPPKRAALSILSPKEQNVIGATKLQQALEASDPAHTGKINLDTFLAKTSDYSQTGEILNKEAYNSLKGLNTYLQSVSDASKVGWWRQAAVGTAVAGATGAGALLAGPVGAGVALASYGAANLVANHSPLKRIFNAFTKDLPAGTADALKQAASRHLKRAGYIILNGTLQHKDDKDIPPQEQINE